MSRMHGEIVRLAKERVAPMLIAQRLGCSKTHVYARISAARKGGEHIPHFSTTNNPQRAQPEAPAPASNLPLAPSLRALLATQARRQGVTPTEIATRILERALLKMEGDDGA